MIPALRSQFAVQAVALLERGERCGIFDVDSRLIVERVERAALPAVARARLSVRLDDDFDIEAARRHYRFDRRVAIRIDPTPPASPIWLFDGFPARLRHALAPHGESPRERCTLELEHAASRLSLEPAGGIVGRRMRDARIAEGLAHDPDTWAAASTPVDGLACAFNGGGRPNCDPEPIAVRYADGRVRRVHLFTWDGDPRAVPWTAARALRYLLHFYVAGDCPVSVDACLAATESAANEPPDGRAAFAIVDPLRHDLLTPLDDVSVESQSVVEALGRIADAANLLIWPHTGGSGDNPDSEWRLAAGRGARRRELNLARGGRDEQGRPRYDTVGRRLREILSDNQVAEGAFEWRRSRATRRLRSMPRRFDLTLPLVPGWLPAEQLDNVAPEDRAAARAAALTPEDVLSLGDDPNAHAWFRRYHARGGEFGAHADVARLWVLNEDGRFDAATYDRNAPFDAYAPFRFDALIPAGEGPPTWTRRARPLLPLSDPAARLFAGGVRVEISFDDGASWFALPRGYETLGDRAGIRLTVDNPLEITPPHRTPAQQNLWYALIEQTLRLRVTAAIECDVLPKTRAAAIGAACVTARPFIPWPAIEFDVGDRVDGLRGRDVRWSVGDGCDPHDAVVRGVTYEFGPQRFGTELTLYTGSFECGSDV